MKPEIEEIVSSWKELSNKLNSYPPGSEKHLPFQILYTDCGYVLSVDLSIFDKPKSAGIEILST